MALGRATEVGGGEESKVLRASTLSIEWAAAAMVSHISQPM
jgi:hypothetical protein